MSTDLDLRELVTDLQGATAKWAASAADGEWARNAPGNVGSYFDVAERALNLITEESYTAIQEPSLPSIALVTKRPHAGTRLSVACIVARTLAFGATVKRVTTLERNSGGRVVQALYPAAWAGYHEKDLNPYLWAAIDTRFNVPAFKRLFGQPYSRDLVVPAESLIRTGGVSVDTLNQIWSEGRRPVEKSTLIRGYGEQIAEEIVGPKESFDWFQNSKWPLGIQRIESGTVVFATRDRRIGGKPTLIVNGFYPGLVSLFEDDEGGGSTLIEIGVPECGVATLRKYLVGSSNDPRLCSPGSIRYDASDGSFPIAIATETVSSRANLVHCSDGLLAGSAELRRLLGERSEDQLTDLLRSRGYEESELKYLIGRDAVLEISKVSKPLSRWTAGYSETDCVDFLLRYFPPQFGPDNGFGDGFPPALFFDTIDNIRSSRSSLSATGSIDTRFKPLAAIQRVWNLDSHYISAGESAISHGRLGLLIPAGGTGGRFGGYSLKEDDRRRQKPLLPLFDLQGSKRSGLEIRLANVRYWSVTTGGRVPVAIMGSPGNHHVLRSSLGTIGRGLSRVDLFEQHGLYRIAADRMVSGSEQLDPFLRKCDGTPITKPPGNLGLFTIFALIGLLDDWIASGVEFLAIGNADDVGFRISPALCGWLTENPSVDAVLCVVPQGFRRFLDDGTEVRGDLGGWHFNASGGGTRESSYSELAGIELDPGGSIVATGDSLSGIALAEGSLESGDLTYWHNTNQMIVRSSSLRKVLLQNPDQPIRSIRETRATLPIFTELKQVQFDRHGGRAIQIMQAAIDIIRILDSVKVMALSRWPITKQYGGFAVLKTPADVPFLQMHLEATEALEDQLLFG